MIIGMCDGVFDLMHWGHILHLRSCKELCDILIVAVADDNFAKMKGVNRPYVKEDLRLFSISSLSCVDCAILCDGSTSVVNQVMPDIYFKSEGYVNDPKLDPDIFVTVMPLYKDKDGKQSTTAIVERIKSI